MTVDDLAVLYSGGLRRRLDLAISMITKPRLLFLDEPTTGLDPPSREQLWNVVRGLILALSWLAAMAGLLAGSAEAAQSFSMVLMFVP